MNSTMLNMLIKQFMPDVNIPQVQEQIKAFAEMFAKMAKSVEHTEALCEALHDEVASLRAELNEVKAGILAANNSPQSLQIGNEHDNRDPGNDPANA